MDSFAFLAEDFFFCPVNNKFSILPLKAYLVWDFVEVLFVCASKDLLSDDPITALANLPLTSRLSVAGNSPIGRSFNFWRLIICSVVGSTTVTV